MSVAAMSTPLTRSLARLGRALQERSEPLAAGEMAALAMSAPLARVHVLDHALAQRADGPCRHGRPS
jgi:hypothetical protein